MQGATCDGRVPPDLCFFFVTIIAITVIFTGRQILQDKSVCNKWLIKELGKPALMATSNLH